MKTILVPAPGAGVDPKQLRAELRARLGQAGIASHERVASVRAADAGVEVVCTDDVEAEAVRAAVAEHVPQFATELEDEVDDLRVELEEVKATLAAEEAFRDRLADLVDEQRARIERLEEDAEWSASVIKGLQAALSARPGRADNLAEE